ncbi:MAG TPA: HIT family protein [Campylobacterales bacterium]|nr:HIT family protein [Campylobacterales bacterium]
MKKNRIYENKSIYIEIEKSEIPWLKVFTQKPYKEFSQTPLKVKLQIFAKIDIIEKEMLSYYNPKKINIASFGNYLPHVHFHVMARFKEDSYFPEPMWGVKQREGKLELKSFDVFIKKLQLKLHRKPRV